MKNHYYTHGKLLLTSEYLVLDGAKALALPTQKGQHLRFKTIEQRSLQWSALHADQSTWFSLTLGLPLIEQEQPKDPVQGRLYDILIAAQELNPSFLATTKGYAVETTLEFPQDWGLGSSSTLIASIALWAGVNAYELLEKTFGGSGYDLACATSAQPLIYERNGFEPTVKQVVFNPSFKDALFFVHLNRKQNSRDSISHYRALGTARLEEEITFFSELTEKVVQADSLEIFESLLDTHEQRLSTILKTPTIKEELFPEYKGCIKSLGGWGGDFILATGSVSAMHYFKEKGYLTILSYKDMILG